MALFNPLMRDPQPLPLSPSTQPHLLMGEIWAEPVGNMTWKPLNISAASGPSKLRPHHPPRSLNPTGRGVSGDFFPLSPSSSFWVQVGWPSLSKGGSWAEAKADRDGSVAMFLFRECRRPQTASWFGCCDGEWVSVGGLGVTEGGEGATCCHPMIKNLCLYLAGMVSTKV